MSCAPVSEFFNCRSMKYLSFLVVLILLFLGGYFLQPVFTPLLVKNQASREVVEKEVTVNGFKVKVDLDNLAPDLIPGQLALKEKVSLSAGDEKESRELEAGETVALVEVRKGHLLVADPAHPEFTALVPSEFTDIFERAAKLKFEAGQRAVATNNPPAATSATPTPTSGAEETPPEMPEDPTTKPEETPEVSTTPEKMPDPAPTDPGSREPVGSEEIVALMKASVESGAIKKFTADQVDAWTVGEPETIDGVDYQVGLVSYQAETIFGVKPVEAKALVRDGKVEKWVYAKTGMEIR